MHAVFYFFLLIYTHGLVPALLAAQHTAMCLDYVGLAINEKKRTYFVTKGDRAYQ